MDPEFSHLDPDGKVRMVDVGDKQVTRREAVAEAVVRMSAPAYAALRSGAGAQGRCPGGGASRRHPGGQENLRADPVVPLDTADAVDVEVEFDDAEQRVVLRASASARWFTGVEMEALTAASVAALTLYDMCKSADRAMVIEQVALIRKSGGRSGEFHRV